ncbi:glycosyltransferase family 4 protein [Ginsengibacter hankyongi]|uniref:Glycosyltransferase family 4 protein n=1 Tax=Ginsengibacter hankyongi TaxID=2607284 RepID=A0A5J5IK55_9BACT|nr:glycosyltransferase family 4 protein [Ginsengibacter hankyongi]KAA9041465.1 glycosyltransferase family 4 protein [Ginsengibacter hankyongi]
MKILMICDFFHENQQYQENLLAKYYLKQGHDVTIIASTFISVFDYYENNYNKKSKIHSCHINGYKLIRLPYSINFYNKLRKLENLKKYIDNELPDLIYVHGIPLNLIDPISYKKRNAGCKLIFDFHGDFSNSANNWLSLNVLHGIFYRVVMKMYFKNLDKIFYITPNGGEFLNKIYGIPFSHMSILPLGADTDYINLIKTRQTNISIREELGINHNDFVIFSGGKFVKEKKIELVIQSFFLIQSTVAHLIIVGDTKDETYKKEILELINSHPRIHYIGWVDGERVYDYMSACNVAVFPASQSVLWQQAIGVGLPLIIGQSLAQDVTYLNRNNHIFIIEKNSVTPEKIYSYLKLLMDDPNLLASMKLNAIKTTRDFLSYDKISEITIR